MVRRKPHGQVSRDRARARGGPGSSRRDSEGCRRRDRAQLRHREDRHGKAPHGDRADRLPGARRRLAAQRVVQQQARRVLPLGRDDAGHHRHGDGPADQGEPRGGRGGPRGAVRNACAASAGAPDDAGRGAQQSAAGDPGHVRLQDGDDTGRRREASRAAVTVAAARARGRIGRRVRHAGVDRARARWRRRRTSCASLDSASR